MTVYGQTTIEKLEKAGAFENIKILPDRAEAIIQEKESFWRTNSHVLLSLTLVVIGDIFQLNSGEESIPAILSFLGGILIGGYSLFKSGMKNITKLDFDMKALMTIAIIGATIIGEWSEGAVVVILFAISESLERYSMDKARASIRSLMNIAPKEALVRRHGKEIMINVNEIVLGDIMLVKPGQKIAMDGEIISGYSSVNQAAITGESVPAEKNAGDEVFAGTLNGEGMLEVKITKLVKMIRRLQRSFIL